MKMKRILALGLGAAIAASALTGCSTGGSSSAAANSAASQSSAAVSTADSGSANPTKLTLWTFVEAHANFYKKMAGKWNEANPTKKVDLTTTVLPYEDMHNKLTTALQSTGAPDLCDIEVTKFSNYLKGTPSLVSLNDALSTYKADVVQSRLDIYAKDGTYYGVPTHVGATVMFYNTELLAKAGIDYKTLTTWDKYRAAGKTFKAKTGKTLGEAETKGAFTLSAIVAQQKGDLTDKNGKPALTSDAVVKAATLMQDMVKDGTMTICTGGYPDNDEAEGWIGAGNVGSVCMPLWYMSRFTNYMKDNSGKWAIAPVPTIQEGQPRSVGLGGTGTVVTNQCKDQKLAAEFITWAKLSDEGEKAIWEDLGFDPVNTKLWSNTSVTKNSSNQFIKYFKTNPFDVLNEVKSEIQLIKNTEASPAINTQLTTATLNEIFADKKDVKSALQEAQDAVVNEVG